MDGRPISAEAREDLKDEADVARELTPGEGAGKLPPNEVEVEMPGDAAPADAPAAPQEP